MKQLWREVLMEAIMFLLCSRRRIMSWTVVFRRVLALSTLSDVKGV